MVNEVSSYPSGGYSFNPQAYQAYQQYAQAPQRTPEQNNPLYDNGFSLVTPNESQVQKTPQQVQQQFSPQFQGANDFLNTSKYKDDIFASQLFNSKSWEQYQSYSPSYNSSDASVFPPEVLGVAPQPAQISPTSQQASPQPQNQITFTI